MKNLLSMIMLIIFSINLFAQTETPPSGSGTSGDPYLIASLDNLAWLQDAANDTAWGAYYQQTANIDASPTSTWNLNAGFSPIGNNTTNFTGTYNGNGYIITSLTINRTSTNYNGFIGFLGGNGIIENLTIQNAFISGLDGTGIIAGENNGGTIEYCHSTGSDSGRTWTGGLVGFNDGGSANPGTILRCVSEAKVSSSGNTTGGLVGQNYNSGTDSAFIFDSYATDSVISNGSYVGELVGYQQVSKGEIKNCY